MTTDLEPTDDDFKAMEPISDTRVAPAQGIAAVALNMSLKYHDIATVKDGAMYQQYKLEGKNMRELHLDMVFETAIKMEAHLMGANERISKLIVDALVVAVEGEET
jgi:hypothetical protein